ncbi:zinc ribbon domain-containing protein [Streptomyces sp. HUCO-GS316]|uniref:zinc ribbon domain-containing protein n=1 Tax=Streptomyces sp. HUCO-GS316 TaxID=2692198 RepID=UPI003FA7750F
MPGLNHSILDAGWGLFFGILAQKADSAARRVIPVDARNTSRTCSPPHPPATRPPGAT